MPAIPRRPALDRSGDRLQGKAERRRLAQLLDHLSCCALRFVGGGRAGWRRGFSPRYYRFWFQPMIHTRLRAIDRLWLVSPMFVSASSGEKTKLTRSLVRRTTRLTTLQAEIMTLIVVVMRSRCSRWSEGKGVRPTQTLLGAQTVATTPDSLPTTGRLATDASCRSVLTPPSVVGYATFVSMFFPLTASALGFFSSQPTLIFTVRGHVSWEDMPCFRANRGGRGVRMRAHGSGRSRNSLPK